MRSANGQFLPLSTPWNFNLRGYMGANKTSFKNGHLPKQTLPKGSITKSYKHGKIEQVNINIDWKGERKTNNSLAWYIWESEHQQDRPKGYVMFHIDGDKENNDLDNLRIITRVELLNLNRRWI